MKLRDEMIQDMFDIANNEELFEDMQMGFDRLDRYITSILPDGEKDKRMDEGMDLICTLEYASFFAGANMVLDFIAGKEVCHMNKGEGYDLYSLSVEISGISAMVTGLGNTLDEGCDRMSDEYFRLALIGISDHLDRIAKELAEV